MGRRTTGRDRGRRRERRRGRRRESRAERPRCGRDRAPGGHAGSPPRKRRTGPGAVAPLAAALAAAATLALPGSAAGQARDGVGAEPPPPANESTPAARALPLLAAAGPALRLDGRLDEAAWAAAVPATSFLQREPDEGRPASQPTEVRILHDADALWIGARLLDGAPDSVEARLARRDSWVHGDWFFAYLDSWHDRRSAFAFGVNAGGVQRDLRLSGDVEEDASWDAVWSAAVSADADGWTAEMRIPLSQLRFAPGGPDASWGVNFARLLGRRNEWSHWAPVPQGSSRFVSLFGRLDGVGTLEPARAVEVVPYAVARLTREPGDPDDPFHAPVAARPSAGADLRIGLPAGLTLSATLNPDFGQVDADPAVVNLSGVETFLEERRPFFVEGAELFRPIYPSWPPLFHSRRVGRAPQGAVPAEAAFADPPSAATILGAAKLSGKTEGGWSVGLLQAFTGEASAPFVDRDGVRGTAVVEPGTRYSVARVSREMREGGTVLGAMATAVGRDLDGTGLDGLRSAAWTGGVDGFHRFAGGAWEARFGLAASHVRGSPEALIRTQRAPGRWFQRPGADHLSLDSARTSLTGWRGGVQLRKASGSWRGSLNAIATSPGWEVNDVGFNTVHDQVWLHTGVGYHRFEPGPLFRNWRLQASHGYGTTFGGERLARFFEVGGGAQLLQYWSVGFWAQRNLSAWDPGALRGGPALRTPPAWSGAAWVDSDPRRALGAHLFAFLERQDGGEGASLFAEARGRYRPAPRWSLELGPSLSLGRAERQFVAEVDAGGEPRWIVGSLDRTTLALSARLEYTFSPRLTLQTYARPFLAAGRYDGFRRVADPAAGAFGDRFSGLRAAPDGDGGVALDEDRDGRADYGVGRPDFNAGSLQVNAVLRWEYRPGSTFFVAWSHDRSAAGDAPFHLSRDLDALRRAAGRNVLMLKASWWLAP